MVKLFIVSLSLKTPQKTHEFQLNPDTLRGDGN